MFCTKCGSMIDDNDKVCPNCGNVNNNNVSKNDVSDNSSVNSNAINNNTSQPKKNKTNLLMISLIAFLCVIVVVLGVVLANMLMVSSGKRDNLETVADDLDNEDDLDKDESESDEDENQDKEDTKSEEELKKDDTEYDNKEQTSDVQTETASEHQNETQVTEVSETTLDTNTNNNEQKLADALKAYAEYLDNYLLLNYDEYRASKFYLDYVDEDNIPELFIVEDDCHAAGVYIYTYVDYSSDKVVEVGVFGGYGSVEYMPRKNIIYTSDYHMDWSYDIFYKINNGYSQTIISFGAGHDMNDPDIIVECYVDDIEVTEQEYNAKYEETMNRVKAAGQFAYVDYSNNAIEITDENIRKMVWDKDKN